MLSNKKTSALTLFCALLSFSAVSQSEVAILPVHNPSHLQIKVMSNGKCLSSSNFISSSDRNISFEAYSFGNEAGSELVIPEIAVDLVRKGRLIHSEIIGENGDLSNIIDNARNKDILRFSVNGVYIRNEQQQLELYSMGTVNLIYSFVEEKNLVMH